MTVVQIARVCHETNRAYCFSIGDTSQKSWEEAHEWQRESAIAGVKYRLENPSAPPSAQHDAWTKDKLEAGWVYGPEKDAEKKTHPCLVAYNELPEEQRKKDELFQAIVDILSPNRPAVMGVTVEEYSVLKRNEAWLRSLEAAGVDNWEGHDTASDHFKENYPEYAN